MPWDITISTHKAHQDHKTRVQIKTKTWEFNSRYLVVSNRNAPQRQQRMGHCHHPDMYRTAFHYCCWGLYNNLTMLCTEWLLAAFEEATSQRQRQCASRCRTNYDHLRVWCLARPVIYSDRNDGEIMLPFIILALQTVASRTTTGHWWSSYK